MEENNQEKKESGYTGEYGNHVEGEFQETGSTYSYSYQDKENNTTTHSGDYYADNRQQNTQNGSAGDTAQNQTAQNNWQNGNSQNTGWQNGNAQNGNSQNTGWQNTGSQNGNFQNNGYQNNGFKNNGYPNAASPNTGNQNKNSLSFGKKFAITVALAVTFGVVAAACYNGVDFVAKKVLGTGTNTRVEKTTTSVNNGSQKTAGVTTGSAVLTNDVSQITEQCMPSVVAITSTTKGEAYYDLFGQYNQGRDSRSSGTGFIVGQNEKELLIATNNHVIDGAKTISVQFIDGEIYEGTEKGSDKSNDLAVVSVKLSSIKKDTMQKIKIADLGDSSETKVGSMVVAIGNALGYGQSVTVGYVSAKDREITESSEDGNTPGNKIKAIQTDAAINPGNSGGPLINMQGQVIGINSAKITVTSVEGVGYAIPISVATPIIDELMNREVLSEDEKGYLGITGSTVSAAGSAYNVPYGVYVRAVAKGGAAEKGGIKVNDVITSINKVEVTTMESLQEKICSYRKGTEVEITVQRSNNGTYEPRKLKVKLQGKESLKNLPEDSLATPVPEQTPQGNDGNNDNNGGNNFWNDFFN